MSIQYVKRSLSLVLGFILLGFSVCTPCFAAKNTYLKRSYSDTDLLEIYNKCPDDDVQRLLFSSLESLELFVEIYNNMIVLKRSESRLKTVNDNFYKSDLIKLQNFVLEGYYTDETTNGVLDLFSFIAQNSGFTLGGNTNHKEKNIYAE